METDAEKFCAQCGAELEEDALFCSECGAPLPKQEETPRNEAPMKDATETPRAEVTTEEPIKTEAVQDEKAAESSETAATVPENSAHKEEAHVEEQPSAETPVAEAPSEETPAKPIAPAPQAVSAPTAQPTQKFCLHCGTPLPMDAMFCNRCGTPQETQPMNTHPVSPQGSFAAQMNQPPLPNDINVNIEGLKGKVGKVSLKHILLAISAVLAISIFLPLVQGSGATVMKLMDISVFLSLFVLFIAGCSAYASIIGKYEVSVITGQSLFVMFLCGVFKYQTALKWGALLLLFSTLGMIIVGLMASLQSEGKVLEPNFLAARWKQIMLQPVKVHTLNIQGVIGTVALALVMIAIPLLGSIGGGIIGDKFEGSWCCIKPNDIPRFIRFKKLTDGKYASGNCRIYIAYDSNEHKQYLTTGEPGGIFAGFAIKTHHIYEFANEKKNTIVDTDTLLIPEARDRYYYDGENKVLLDKTDEQYFPMGEGDEELKKAYDTLLDYHKKDSSIKGGKPPSFQDYKDAVRKVLDEKINEEEQYYKRQTR